MLQRARSLAPVVAIVLVAVPILFGLIDGATGVLIGLAFSGLVVVVAAAAYGVLTLVTRRIDRLEERLVKVARKNAPAAAVPKNVVTVPRLRDELGKERARVAKRVQDIVNLFEMVPIRSGIPTLGLWTASADLLVALLDRLVHERPATVVEGGSGVSTVLMALAVREHNLPTRIVALEAQPKWAEVTRQLLERHGVAEYAEVRLAPLAPTSLDDHETPWYDESALADLTDIGLVLVDGPPEGTGERARYPMVPLLRDRFAPRCTILVDDTDRPGDADVVDRWRPLLPDFEFGILKLDKGAAIITRK